MLTTKYADKTHDTKCYLSKSQPTKDNGDGKSHKIWVKSPKI